MDYTRKIKALGTAYEITWTWPNMTITHIVSQRDMQNSDTNEYARLSAGSTFIVRDHDSLSLANMIIAAIDEIRATSC